MLHAGSIYVCILIYFVKYSTLNNFGDGLTNQLIVSWWTQANI